ncbi:uncharacterized protein (DUF302 family) [Mesocricetibacter intestinalis]|uniref:Uncharacterized protein (DUF302 family) n=1 Tax=Mesocricetibacter intestinalis TaxID=1521930 RepID=A0A4R6VBL1_9PAST|nr:DUF302 domain-containing protein [Mesocricetibacter intestinalis]TDQ59023.1 uncharacterized protein (DUF302 family) [Mesocricetibacter intestinalis]
MKVFKTLLLTLPLISAPLLAQAETAPLKTVKSGYDSAQTLDKIKQAVEKNGLKLFTVIDHQAAAKEAGLSMPFASVVIFGNPKAGTPMMLAAPTLAIDLPVKALVWEDQKGEVFVTLNDTDSIGKKHGLNEEVYGKLKNLEKLIPQVVTKD